MKILMNKLSKKLKKHLDGMCCIFSSKHPANIMSVKMELYVRDNLKVEFDPYWNTRYQVERSVRNVLNIIYNSFYEQIKR